MEVHTFRTPDGASYEYSVTNPSEDAVTSLLAAQAAAATGDSVLALTANLASPLAGRELQQLAAGAAAPSPGTLGALSLLPASAADVAAALAAASGDPLAALLAAEQRSIEVASHRVASDFRSAIPRGLRLHPRAFRLTCFLEIVAAARFNDADAVYIAFELVLPPGGGWTLLADGSGRPLARLGGAGTAVGAGSGRGGDFARRAGGGSTLLLSDHAAAAAGRRRSLGGAGAGGKGAGSAAAAAGGSGAGADEYGAVILRRRVRARDAQFRKRERQLAAAAAAAASGGAASQSAQGGADSGTDADAAAADADEGFDSVASGAGVPMSDLGRSGPRSGYARLPASESADEDDGVDAAPAGASGGGGSLRRRRGARPAGSAPSSGQQAGGDGDDGSVDSDDDDDAQGRDGGSTAQRLRHADDDLGASRVGGSRAERTAREYPVATMIAGVTQVARFARKRWQFSASGGGSGSAAAAAVGGRPGMGCGAPPGGAAGSGMQHVGAATPWYDSGRFDPACGGSGTSYASMQHTRGTVAQRLGAQKQQAETVAAARAARLAGISPGAAGAGALSLPEAQPTPQVLTGPDSIGPATASTLHRPAGGSTLAGGARAHTVGGTDSLLSFSNGYASGAGSVSLVTTASFDGVTDTLHEDANTLARSGVAAGVRHHVAAGGSGGSSGGLGEVVGIFDGSSGAGGSSLVSLLDTERVPVAHVCYPLDIHLVYEPPRALASTGHSSRARGGGGGAGGGGGTSSSEEDGEPRMSALYRRTGGLGTLKSPTVYFAVYSKDSWERHHVHGYGALALPLGPGVQDHSVRTWLPTAPLADQEADYLLGGGGGLSDITYVAIPEAAAPAAIHLRGGRDGAAAAEAADGAGAATAGGGGAGSIPSASAAVQRAEVTLSKLGAHAKTSGEIAVRTHSVLVRPAVHVGTLRATQAAAAEEARAQRSKTVTDIIAQARALRERLKTAVTAGQVVSLGGGTASPSA
jgi:hypothetical protein